MWNCEYAEYDNLQIQTLPFKKLQQKHSFMALARVNAL
jgi:hypothetical protein